MIGIFFDQASETTGWSIYDNLKLLDYGHYTVEDNDINIRIVKMKQFVNDMIHKHVGEIYGIEDIQFQKNQKTYKQLAELLGTLQTNFIEQNLLYFVISPTTWKSTCKVKGRARKEQKANSIKFVKEKFGLDVSEDEADAINIGWHCMSKEVPKIKVRRE